MKKHPFVIIRENGNVWIDDLDMQILIDDLIMRDENQGTASLFILRQIREYLEVVEEEIKSVN